MREQGHLKTIRGPRLDSNWGPLILFIILKTHLNCKRKYYTEQGNITAKFLKSFKIFAKRKNFETKLFLFGSFKDKILPLENQTSSRTFSLKPALYDNQKWYLNPPYFQNRVENQATDLSTPLT